MISPESVIILIACILIIVKASDWIIKAGSNIAKEIGITDYLIGFAIVAFGTSLPELATAIFGSLRGETRLVLGNLIGAGILDATLVLGLMAIFGQNITISGQMFKTFDQTMMTSLAIVLLPLVLGFDGVISRIDGIILVAAYAVYLAILIRREEHFKHYKHIVKRDVVKDIFILIIGFPLLLVSAKYLVNAAIDLSLGLGISSYIIGLSVLALGTTFSELIIELRSVVKSRTNIGFGDVLGSLIANVSLILGIAAIIFPIEVKVTSYIISALFLVMATFVALLFLQKKTVTWKEGLALIMIYITFLISEVILV